MIIEVRCQVTHNDRFRTSILCLLIEFWWWGKSFCVTGGHPWDHEMKWNARNSLAQKCAQTFFGSNTLTVKLLVLLKQERIVCGGNEFHSTLRSKSWTWLQTKRTSFLKFYTFYYFYIFILRQQLLHDNNFFTTTTFLWK